MIIIDAEKIGEYEAFVKEHSRFNFACCLADSIGFPLGISFISIMTIMPLFVKQLTDSNLAIGLIPAINSLGMLLPQLLIANYIERLPIKRMYVFWVAISERLALLIIALFAIWFGKSNPQLLLLLYFVCWGWHSLSMGFNFPAYYGLISKVIPVNRRGKLYGVGGAVGGLLGLLGAGISQYLLNGWGFPWGFAYCFIIATIILTISVAPLAVVREPVYPKQKPRKTLGEYFKSLPGILKTDYNFSRYIISQVIFYFSIMAPAFYTVYAINKFGVSTGGVAIFTAIIMGTNTIAHPIWGYLADRRGYKLVLSLSLIFMIIAPLWALLAPSLILFYLVFVLNSIAITGYGISNFNIILEFSPPDNVPTYMALSSTICSPFKSLTPILGGIIADKMGYSLVFIIATIAASLSFIVLSQVEEPRLKQVVREIS